MLLLLVAISLLSLSNGYEVCQTPACLKLANFLQGLVDKTANPCVDFYQYACGNWLKTTTIPPGEYEVSVDKFSATVIDNTTKEALDDIDPSQKTKYPRAMIYAKRFYSHCYAYDKTDESSQLEVMDYLKNFADWPFFNPAWDPKKFDTAKVLGQMEADLNMDSLVLLSIEPDKCNSSNTALYIKPSELTTDAIYYNQSLFPEDFLKHKFVRVVQRTLEQIALNLGVRHTVKYIRDVAEEVVNFEMDIGSQLDSGITPGILKEVDKESNAEEPHMPVNLTLLNNQFPLDSSWDTFLSYTFRNNSKQLDQYLSHLYLTNRDFMTYLSKKLRDTPKRTIANYLMWRLIYTGLRDDWIDPGYIDIPSIPFSQSELTAAESSLVGTTSIRRLRKPIIIGDKPKKNRDKSCLDDTKLYFDYVIGRLYVDKRFSPAKLVAAKKLTDDIQHAFMDTLKKTKWLSDLSRSRVLDKLQKLNKNVGYPEWILNDTRLNEYYRAFRIRSNSSYFRNVLKFRQADVGPLNDLARKNTFVLPVATVRNAAYSPETNSITIPAGQLEFPYFDQGFPDWYNYATVGYTIGHELTHGYDTNGDKYDGQGNICPSLDLQGSWLFEGSNKTYDDLTQCLVDDFNRYCYQFIYVNRSVPLLDVILSLERFPTTDFDEPTNSSLFCINGQKTLDENIADLNGFRIAYTAFKTVSAGRDVRLPGFENYTSDQLFFLAFGAGWCDSVAPLGLKIQLITDVHSPADARVNVLLSHISQFSSSFNCQFKDPMFARHQCDLF